MPLGEAESLSPQMHYLDSENKIWVRTLSQWQWTKRPHPYTLSPGPHRSLRPGWQGWKDQPQNIPLLSPPAPWHPPEGKKPIQTVPGSLHRRTGSVQRNACHGCQEIGIWYLDCDSHAYIPVPVCCVLHIRSFPSSGPVCEAQTIHPV